VPYFDRGYGVTRFRFAMTTRSRSFLPVPIASVMALLACTLATAQTIADPGFKSVGRGAPLVASVPQLPTPTPSPQETQRLLGAFPFVGPIRLSLVPPAGKDSAAPPVLEIGGAWNGAVPAGIKPLSVDLFTSKDFYQDRALWSDPRYFRCNSPEGLQDQRGALAPLFAPMIGDHPPQSAAWGRCDRDFPRRALLSPYPFKTAQAHFEALLAETKKRGGPTVHTIATLPADWSGRYDQRFLDNWYQMMFFTQVPTILSLLTPEYQQRMVQDLYHQGNDNAAQWPASYCWPEGFIRRWYGAAVYIQPHQIVATPQFVQILAGVARNFITDIYIGRSFNMQGAVPHLGPEVAQWYGETIGFWDGDALITWTSNIQPWTAHGAFEFSHEMQTVEIYTPTRDARGHIVALNHEAVFYDPVALVAPIRIVRTLDRLGDLGSGNPYSYIECIPTVFPVNGIATHVIPGTTIPYDVPDIYGRPWAQIWEKYHEQGMHKPRESDDILDFNHPGTAKP
jgi:hypothetical protein